MKPVKTPESNFTFILPGGTKENNLPVCQLDDLDGQPMIISTWELDEDERNLIAEGARIQLAVWGSGHPPVMLSVEYQEAKNA